MSSSCDDWCFLDSETGSVRSPSVDVAEPEIELESMYVEETIAAPKVIAPRCEQVAEEIEVDVASLLDGHYAQSTEYSRSFHLSLLSAEHQVYVTSGLAASAKPTAWRRPVREAFTTPSGRVHNQSGYVARLRSAMPSRHAESIASKAVEETPIKPFTRDQAVQTDPPQPVFPEASRLTALSSALDRSLHLSAQLKTKAHDAERADVRRMLLLNQRNDLQQEKEQLKRQLRVAERGLRISRKNGELAEEYQNHLKRSLEQLRSERDVLHQRLEVLAGGLDVATKSISELEQLEDDLEKAMMKVRTELRTKYRGAISPNTPASRATPKPSEDECVVCMERLSCVRLEPCGHEVLCSECSLRVAECPVDRKPIEDKVLTHGVGAYTSSD